MKLKVVVLAICVVLFSSCGDSKKETKPSAAEKAPVVELDPMKDKGVGPIKNLTLAEIDESLATEGKAIFKTKCSACHKMSKRFVGPGLAGVTERRTPEWIMNMILDPELMVAENTAAKKLLEEYLSPMANQSLTEDEARAILEYFRTVPSKK